jgi:hypothetical protein
MVSSATTNLKDGQIITLNVSGFDRPDPGQLTLLQCPPDATSGAACDQTTIDALVTNGDGTGSSPFAVKLRPGLCDAGTPCSVFAVENPLRFDNASPGDRFAKVDLFLATAPSSGGASAPAPPAVGAADPEPVVPETGVTMLLPIGAAATMAIGGTLALRRRRRER